MSDGIILKKGTGVDTRNLTATPEDVVSLCRFLGAGSDEIQPGKLLSHLPITKEMSVNEKYAIPSGHIKAGSVFYQDSVVSEEGRIINPGSGGITIDVSGKYLTTNTFIMSVENLKPEMIKDGVTIGDIVGNYQGFPDEE